MKAFWTALLAGIVMLWVAQETLAMSGRHADLPDPEFHFNTFMCAWGATTTPEFRDFLERARPEIVQVGFYGPMFHGYADNPQSTGYPMQLPVSGQREALAAQRKVNEQIHELGLKVVAHFQMINVIADLEEWNGFLDFYDNGWLEDVLGPKPHPDVRELLQRDAEGNIITQTHYVNYVGLCPSSPHARQMQKQMLKVAIDGGVDGIVMNYNYRWSCCCPYCQASFKRYLDERFTAQELKDKFGIEDLAEHRFERIAAQIPGYPDAEKAPPIDWQAARWGALASKEAVDELLIEYGRGLKPDLIIARWDHIGHMGISEERMFTPVDLWAKGENYFWYSGGYGPTKLAEHQAGDGWLNCLYIREMSDGKPFMLGKYEPVRMRNSIAEGVATGGSGMGFYFKFQDPVGSQVGERYLRFLKRNEELYWPVESFAEVGLLFPRQSIWNAHPEAMDAFRALGNALIEEHVLLDVVADEKLTAERLSGYKVVALPAPYNLADEQCAMLEQYVMQGGRVLVLGDAARADQNGAAREPAGLFGVTETPATAVRRSVGLGQFVWLPAADVPPALKGIAELGGEALSTFEAPWTVKVSAFLQPNRLILHCVNYNRDEEAGTGGTPAAECPIAATDIGVSLRLPDGLAVRQVTLLSPDQEEPQALPWEVDGARLKFRLPSVEVYGVVEVRVEGRGGVPERVARSVRLSIIR